MTPFLLVKQCSDFGVEGATVPLGEGIVFSSGRVVLEWLANVDTQCLLVYEDFEKMRAVHCCEGRSYVRWPDGTERL